MRLLHGLEEKGQIQQNVVNNRKVQLEQLQFIKVFFSSYLL